MLFFRDLRKFFKHEIPNFNKFGNWYTCTHISFSGFSLKLEQNSFHGNTKQKIQPPNKPNCIAAFLSLLCPQTLITGNILSRSKRLLTLGPTHELPPLSGGYSAPFCHSDHTSSHISSLIFPDHLILRCSPSPATQYKSLQYSCHFLILNNLKEDICCSLLYS